ncbi:hypothetical protein JCM18904_5055 [Vibrio sp. JCM 18904]|nr:hypothetical protein JCM18904_5055 [Vibrio sp. JCM 18904]
MSSFPVTIGFALVLATGVDEELSRELFALVSGFSARALKASVSARTAGTGAGFGGVTVGVGLTEDAADFDDTVDLGVGGVTGCFVPFPTTRMNASL